MNRFYRLVWSDARAAWVPVAEISSGRGKRGGRTGAVVTALLAALGLSIAMPAFADAPVAMAPPVHELPTGGNVVAGSATINTSSTADAAILNIDQSSQRAVIDWNTFNVGSAAQVNFNQPNANAATLNRVLDSNASQIFGKITSTGQVFLLNPNGVYFGKSAQVDVGALTATTGSISNDDFMSGNLHFTRGNGNGSIVNEGELRAALGGYIALLAPEVRNSGVIIARLGTVALAAGDAFTLQIDANHLTGITIQPATMKALVENKGAVLAPGGLIIMSAQAFDRIQGGVVNNSGTVEATGLAMKNGRIVLEASSKVSNSGLVSANAGSDGSPAGNVTINAPAIDNSGRIEAVAPIADVVNAGGHVALNAEVITQSDGGVIDTSGFTGGNIELTATQDITLAGAVLATATVSDDITVDADNHGGNIAITANKNITLQSAVVDASGDAAGGKITVQGGHQEPGAPAGDPNTLALLGNTQLRTSSRRGRGGSVSLSGDQVGLFDHSAIDASGATGGGDVKVGGGFHGEDTSIANARAAYVDANVTIKADALSQGDGGKVVVWSDDSTRFLGEISARGGATGGDGGFVEVSSKGVLDFRGNVYTLAPQGRVGSLLLDPWNLTISNASDSNINGATPFDASGTGSILNVTTLQNALANSDVTVTTGVTGGEAGNLTVANTVGWFTDYSLTLAAAGTITVNNGVAVTAAGNGNITFTTTGGDIINSGAIRTFGGNFTATTQGGGGAIYGAGSYNIAGTATFTTAGNIGLSNAANKFVGAVSLLAGGGNTLVNSVATVLKGATADSNGISISSGGSITTGASPTGITTTGALSLTTTSATNGSIIYTGAVSAGGDITLAADGNGAIAIADIDGAAKFVSVVAGGAIVLGDSNTGALTFDSASGDVLSGTAGSSGQASGAVTITGSAITINDPFVTKGGNINLISTSGAVTANTGASITTTANTDTGTASGGVTVTAANGITLQNIVTTGANNSLGVGSNSSAVTLTATTGDVNVGAITTSGGNATAGATSNRNGGNAGNMVITAPTGIIYLNGDLNAIGGSPVGTATQGLGGYIDMETAVVLTANRSVSSGATSGDVLFNSTVDSDGTPRSLSVTAGIGSVIFNKAVGGISPLSSLTVASSTTTSARGNITTNAVGGVAITASSAIRLGDDTVTNGTGSITINTLAGNGTVNLNSLYTYLDDAVTFTRGTGAITFTNYLHSKATERNSLTFNGAGGGAITVGVDVGGTTASVNTALGDILVSTVTDLTFGRGVSARSLISLNSTGRLSLSGSTYGSFFDGASGFQVATTGAANSYAGDENVVINGSVTLSNASAPLSVRAINGTLSAYAYTALTTAGGSITLTASGSLTLPSNGSLSSSGGLVSLTGVGVTQAVDSSVNAGSGKIRVDGGNAAVALNGTLITTNADTGSSPAVLITRASTVSLRSVTAQTGTLQVGLVGSTNSLATSQTLGSASALTLTGNTSYYSPRRITLTGTGNNSGVSFTINGTDASGNAAQQIISGANNGTATTTQYFATVTSITTNGATAGNVTAGVANESTTGSLTQYLPGGYTNAIDIHNLSAASNAAIALTSSSNTIDQLGSFSVGSSLDVQARGRSAGMQLTGNVTATDVVIKTGNGALVLGDYNITSTTGNVWLQGTGVTQTANSTITSAGTTQIYGNDYQNGTRGNVTMAGSIVSASDVYIYSTLNLTLPNITIGTAGSRGTLTLGWNSNNCSPCNTYNGIYGTISQTAGTAIKVGTLQGLQVAGYGTTDLTNANNEIRYLGYFYRGGAFSANDADVEANGLTSTSSISDGSNNSTIKIKTEGAYNLNGQQLYGQGLTISANSISGSGNLYGHSGSGGSIVLIANGGNITLSGDTYTDGTGADLIIRNANNLQLGSRTRTGNAALTLGADATTGTLSASQAVAGAGNLSINGTSASAGSVTFAAGQRVEVTSAGNDSGISYTVTGTDMFGKAQTETITGANIGTASGAKYFNTVTQIAASGAAAGSVSVGTRVELIAGNVTQTGYIENVPTIQGNVGGSITLAHTSNTFQKIGNLTSGGNMTMYSAVNPLTVSGAALSTGGNVAISSGYNLVVNGTGSVTASGATKGVTLTSGTTLTFGNNSDYSTTIQGAIAADTGGVTINSAGSLSNNSTGTITTSGGVSLKTYWDTLNARNLTLGGNITAGANGIKLNSSGTINQTGGILTTPGAVSGPDSSGGGAPGVSNPSARGAVTLNGNNQVGSLGPFYVYNTSGSAFSFRDTSGGLTLSGAIQTSNGALTISTAGGVLNLATYGVYAGELASGGANVSLTGQGITQASGTISATGSSDGTTPRNGSSGGTITLTGYDGTASGAINLGGTISTANNTTSAVTIRGTAALALPNIVAPNGSLNVGDNSQTYYRISGAITQNASTSLDIKTLNVVGDSSAVLANTGNKIVQLGSIAVGDNAGVNYDFDVYNSTNGLSLTSDVVSGGGVRIVTAQGAGSSGALAIGSYNIYGVGNIYLGALGITQGSASIINANQGGSAGSGGDVTVDGGGGTNNITLAGTVRTDGAGKSLSVINATNATLNVISATAGNVVLGTNVAQLTGSIALVPTTGVVSANTLSGNAGIVNVSVSNIDNLGTFITSGALTLKDQGGAGTAGLKLTGNVTVGAASSIESTDGVLDLDTNSIDASGGTGYDLVLKGVGVSQGVGSSIKSTTANIFGSSGNINLFSVLNDFTGQVTVNSTGSQVSIQDANTLSMNSLTGKLANTTSFTAWAGTNLVLTPESLTTTSGSIDLRSLNGNLSTPGNLTTGSGSITLLAGGTGSNGNVQVNNLITSGSGNVTVQASKQANLSNSIVSTSGNISVTGDTLIHSTGSPGNPLTLQTAGAGTITVNAAGTGGFVMGQYYSYQSAAGLISITSGGTADLANITSTSGDVTVNAVGAVQQLASSSVKANAVSVATTSDGTITLANANNNAAFISLRSLNVAGNAAGTGAVVYNDLNAVAVRRIQTTGNATLTAGGAITTDTVTGPGTVVADALSVKTLNDTPASIALTAAGNDVTTLTLKVRNAADTTDVGVAGSSGSIDYTDTNGFTIAGIQTGGNATLTAGGAVAQTGAILTSGLGLAGAGSFTLNNASSGVPINQVSTFASDASGAVNFSSNRALTVGTVVTGTSTTGVTSHGAAVTISANSINATSGPIDTRSATPATAGGAVTLTTTGLTTAGNLTVGSINTSGSNAGASTNGNGGAAGTIALTSTGDTISFGGVITARGGAGDGSGITGADGLVTATANAGAVTQTNGSGTHAIDAGKLLVGSLNASSLLDTGNTTDFLAAKITGAGQGFTYRSAGDYTVGAGNGTITGLTTQGGAIDLGSSNVAITSVETITTKGGNFTANNVGSFDSTGVTISTLGDITFAAGAYKNGGVVNITTTTGDITTGAIVTSGDSSASAATAGSVTLNANNVLTTGSITSTGAGTSVGGGVNLTGATVRLGGQINSGGGTGGASQAAGGNIIVTGPAVVYGANLVLDSGSGSGDVTFNSTINSDNIGSIRSLTVNSGTGNINLQGALGNSVTLNNVALNASGSTNVGAAVMASSLTTDATGTTHINGGSINTTGNQTYNDDVVLGATTTLTSGGNVNFVATVKSDGTNRALTVNNTGATTFAAAVGGDGSVVGEKLASLTTDAGGTTAINGGTIITTAAQTYGDNVTLGANTTLTGGTVTTQGTVTGNTRTLDIAGNAVFGNDTSDSVTGVATLAVSGATTINTSTITSTGAQTYNGGVTLGADATLTGVGLNFVSTVISDGTNRALTINDSGTTTFAGAVGGSGTAGDRLASLTTNAGGTTAINGGSIITSGTQTYGDTVSLGADTTLTGSSVTNQNTIVGNSHALGITGNAVFGNDSSDSVTGVTTLGVSGTTLVNTNTITSSGAQTYTGAVTLGTNPTLTGSAINFGSTVDGDANNTRSLNLVSTGGAGQNFVAAVGGIHALDTLRIESVGVVTQGGSAPIHATNLAIKSASGVTLTNASNAVDVLAALLSGNASLSFVDSDGLEIGTVGTSGLQVVGISDGAGTSTVSITVGGQLTQAASSPINLHGSLAIDTSAYNAGDVTVDNTGATGTVLGNSLIAGDFTLSSTGNVTQASGAHLQVGGNFNVNGGSFIDNGSADNLIGGGSASVSGGQIRLYGIITLSMDAGTGDLLASAFNGTTTNTASIDSADLASGVQVVSAAGGNSISAVNSGQAVTLNNANNIGGSLSITTQGSYANNGTPVATGINQSNALNLSEASFTVQQSAANAGSVINGAGKLDLSNAANTFAGPVAMTAVGMDAKLAASTNLNLDTVNAQTVTITTPLAITQVAGRIIQANTLLLNNAQSVTLNNANLVSTLAATGITGALSFNDAQTLSVGTASSVDGISSSGSVLLKTTAGDLVLDESITVTGSSNITLVSAANFTNNVGANALTLGTGHWQVWSSDPSLDTLNGLSPGFKQYNATYGTSSVLGSGNGVLYTLAPTLTVGLTGAVERVYNGDVDATLTQANYNITGTVGGDAVVLGTSGTFDNKNVNNGKTVTVNPVVVSASNGAVQVYGYQINSGSATVSAAIGKITPAAISAVTGITAANKSYDSTTAATLNTTSTVGFTGMFTGDQLNVATATGNFASPNASASPITVNITGITLGGTDAGNYTLSATTASTTALINAYAVNLTGTRVYDGTTAVGAGSLTIGTLVNGQTLNLSGTGTAASRNAGLQTVNTTGLALGDGTGLASNYTFVGGTQTVNITKANLSLTTTDVTKSYNGSLAATGSAIATNSTQLFTTDTVSGGTYAFTNANAGTGKTVTTTAVTINDGNSGNNYVVSYVNNTTSTINKADITVSTANVIKTYDGALTAVGTPTVVSGALYNNASNSNVLDSLSGGSYAFTDKNAGAGNKSVTVTGVTVTDGNSGGNYNVTYANNTTSTINPFAVNVTGTRVYDGTTLVGAGTLTLGTLVGSETLGLSGTGTAASKNVGLETVNTTGLSLADGSNGGLASNYTFVGGTQTINITKANLTVTTSDITKVYDGSLSAIGSAVATSGTQLFGTDSLAGGTYAFTNANAGTGNKTVTTTGVTVNDGNSGGNYTVTYVNNTSSTINPASITVSTSNVTRTYDGTLSAIGNAVVIGGTLYNNASNGNALDSLNGGSFAFTDKNAGAGNKSVSTSGVTVVDGNSGSNYVVTYVNNTTSTIDRATVAFVGEVADKEYDGNTTASLSGYTLTGLIGGETLGATATTANFIDKNAGIGKTVNIGGVALSDGNNGGLASNYIVAGTATSTATIDPKVLTINAVVSDKVYDGTVNASLQSYGLAGFVGAETVSGVFTGSASFADKNVGTDKAVTITGVTLVNGANGGLATNYAVSTNANSNADITKATLNIAGVVAEDKVYDGTLIANLNSTAAQITGKFGSDDVSIGLITGTYQTKDVGTNKAIGAGTVLLGGVDAGNYDLVQPTGLSSSITPRVLAVVATGNDKVYDGTTSATVNLSDNRISGDVLDVAASSAFADKNAGNGKYVGVSNIALSGTDALNYTVNSTTATVANISKAGLIVTAVGVNKVYDATTAATVSLSSQAIGNDVVNVGYSNAAFVNKNVGTAKQVSIGGVVISGADAGNYTISAPVTATADITPATLTIGATGNNKLYDGTTAATVALTDNRFSGDQVVVGNDSANFATPDVGSSKAVTVDGIHFTGGVDAGNYVLANTSTTTTADIMGTSNVAVEVAQLPPTPTIAPISVTVPTAPPAVVDLTLPAGFGRAPGGSNTTLIGGSTTTLIAGTNTTTNSGGTNSVGGTTGVNGSTGTGTGANGSIVNSGSTTSGSATSSTTGGTSGVNGSTTATGANVTTSGRSSTGSSTNANSNAATSVNASNAKSADVASGNKGAASLISVSVDQAPSGGRPGVVSVAVPADAASSGKAVSFALPEALAQAAVGQEVRVSSRNGSPLPSWLQYMADTKAFTMSSMPSGALPIEVLVRIGDDEWIIVITVKAEQ